MSSYDRVRNDKVLQQSGRTSLSHLLSRRRISVFGHVARLDDVTPVNMALQLRINVSLNRPPDRTWRRPPGRPRNKLLDQLRNDSTHPTGDLWRRAVDRRHGGATTRRPSPAIYATMMMMMMMIFTPCRVDTRVYVPGPVCKRQLLKTLA